MWNIAPVVGPLYKKDIHIFDQVHHKTTRQSEAGALTPEGEALEELAAALVYLQGDGWTDKARLFMEGYGGRTRDHLSYTETTEISAGL